MLMRSMVLFRQNDRSTSSNVSILCRAVGVECQAFTRCALVGGAAEKATPFEAGNNKKKKHKNKYGR